jgi:DNA-binding CsgD family transcriptional regulator
MTIRARDVRTLLQLSDPLHRIEPIESVWESALSTIKALVPCDAVSFPIQDIAHRGCVSREVTDKYETYLDPADNPAYWNLFWSVHCSYPQRSGDYISVTTPTDFESRRQILNGPTGEFLRANGMRHEVIVPMPPLNSLDYQVMLWRADGRDFSERDRLLLAMVRPHLLAIRDATFKRDGEPSPLTGRQRQLVSLIASGLTNRQIARQLGLSEHTVRKHVENIFERLQVNSRTAAATRVLTANPSDRG